MALQDVSDTALQSAVSFLNGNPEAAKTLLNIPLGNNTVSTLKDIVDSPDITIYLLQQNGLVNEISVNKGSIVYGLSDLGICALRYCR